MLDITTANMNLVDGQVTLGLGTGDAQVRRIWVLGPNHALANVFVPANALPGTAEASLISGMQVATSPSAFQVQAARPGAPAIASIANAADPTQAINPGSFVSIFGPNVAQTFAGVQLSLNDTPIQIGFANSGQISFQVPANFPTGPATLRLISSGVAAPPI